MTSKYSNRTGKHSNRTGLLPLVLIVSLFFLWGVANNLNDILITQFKKAFTLSDFKSGLVQSAFYMGYFLLSIPAALWMKRFGYKAAVVFGLMLYRAGALLFYPAAEARDYSFFLGALFVIASGLAFLETSANPLIVVMGDPDKAEWRLNLAQSFNPLGALSGIYIGREFILSGHEPSASDLAAMSPAQLQQFYQTESHAVQGPYLLLACVVIVWALLVVIARFPRVATEPQQDAATGSWADYKALLRNGRFMRGVNAQFFYVGAQVCVWSFMIRYGQASVPGLGEKVLANYLFGSLVAFMVGRFASTALMARYRASWLMWVYGLINVGLCTFAILAPGLGGLIALAATSFFMSLMFPTIFALSVKGLGAQTKAGSSLVSMAIIGGAVFTALMGLVSDLSAIHFAVVVPLVCFLVVAFYARTCEREQQALDFVEAHA